MASHPKTFAILSVEDTEKSCDYLDLFFRGESILSTFGGSKAPKDGHSNGFVVKCDGVLTLLVLGYERLDSAVASN